MYSKPFSLGSLCQDERRRSEEREWMGQAFTLHHFDYEKGDKTYVIWGLTAGILIHAASVVYQRPPDFAERRVQFNLPKNSKESSPMPWSGLGCTLSYNAWFSTQKTTYTKRNGIESKWFPNHVLLYNLFFDAPRPCDDVKRDALVVQLQRWSRRPCHIKQRITAHSMVCSLPHTATKNWTFDKHISCLFFA